MKGECLLYSGGLDSACCWWILNKPDAFFVGGNFGPAREASIAELKAVQIQRSLVPEFKRKFVGVITDLTIFMRNGEWKFPRDQLCATLAWAQGYNKVLLGWCKNDRTVQHRAQEQCAKITGAVGAPEFQADAPLFYLTKAELINQALALGCPEDFIRASWSCVKRSDVHCGNCMNCCERYVAFKTTNLPTDEYMVNPQKSGGMKALHEKHKGSDWWTRQAAVAGV